KLDIKPIGFLYPGEKSNASVSSRQIARYLAKYVTKSVADFGIGTRKFSAAAIDQLDVTEHLREILKTIVEVAEEEDYREIVSWVHTLGYRGHVMSKSRQFSTTMTALREHRAAWRKSQIHDAVCAIVESRIPQPIWQFHRVGHTNLGDRVLVVSAFGRA